MMRRTRHLLLMLFFSPMAMATQVELGGGVEYYQWEEFADNGDSLLTETGPRYFIEVKGTNRVENRWWQDFSCRLYSGTVNYDGQTMGGTPITSDTDYSGVRAEVGFNYLTRNRSEQHSGDWLVRFGLGIDSWRRGIQSTTTSGGIPVSGYSERYLVSYATVAGQYLGSGWRGGVGVVAPYYTTEEVSILPGSTLHPAGQLSLQANVEFYLAAQWSLVLEYESYRFAKSDEVRVDPVTVAYQPKSNRDSYSAFVRYHF